MKKWVSSLGVLQIFGALLLVIMVMSASNWVVHRNSISDIYEKMVEHNSLSVKYMIQTFDDRFQAINNLIYTIHSLPYDNMLDRDGFIDMSRVYTLQHQVESLMSSHDVVEDVIVFYENVPLAITSKGTSSLEHLFERKYRHPIHDAHFWKGFLRTKHDLQVFPAEDYTVLSSTTPEYKKKKLMAVVSGNRMAVSNKNILVLVDVDALLQQVNRAGLIPGASLIVLDQNRRFLMGTGADWDLVEVLNDVYFHARREASLTREDYEYHIYQSDYNGFIYIDRVPYQFQNLTSVTQANRAIIWTSIFSAVILSVLLSLYLNRPVRNILRLLGGGHSKGNDFRKIYSGIVKLQTENQQYRKQLAFVDNELRRGVFLRVLEDTPHSEEHERELEKYKPDLLRQRYFVMAALHVERTAPGEAEVPAETLSAILQKELRSAGLDAAVFHERGFRFLTLLGLKEANGRAKLLRQVREAIRNMEKGALQDYRIRGCLSRLYGSDFEHCREAYEDVRYGMMHRPVNAAEAIFDADEWPDQWGVHVPLEQMEKLSNCLIGGKIAEAHAIIRETLQKHAECRIGLHQMEHVAKAMFYHMLRLADASGLDGNALRELERRFHRAVEDAFDFRQTEQTLIEAATFIGTHGRKEQPGKLNPAFISQYIELHYMENLYLDHMAEIFNTTPKYFSNYFKKTFGVNFVDYLNKVRLAHARELLRRTTLSVAEIGEKTGYLNASTFASTFKKYYGISPSDFRKQELGA